MRNRKNTITLLKIIKLNKDVGILLNRGLEYHQIAFLLIEAEKRNLVIRNGNRRVHLKLTRKGRMFK